MPQYIVISEATSEVIAAFYATGGYSARESCKETMSDKTGDFLLCEVSCRLTGRQIIQVETAEYPGALFGGKFEPKLETEVVEVLPDPQ